MSGPVLASGRSLVIPASKINRGLGVGIPSLGLVPIEFALSLANQAMPINFGCIYLFPENCRWDWEKNDIVQTTGRSGLPVADARNVIAKVAINLNLEWLFFRDDDTIAPPDAINKLFTLARDLRDAGVPFSCIGGNYMSKQVPPHSLILCDGHLAGYEAWEMGSIVGGEKTAIGMGCTLIPVEVLKKMEPPWFKTVDSLDPKASIVSPLAGGIVHTGNDIQDVAPGCVRMTEDVYFCRKASRFGFTHVYCDTSIQCQHIDIGSRRKYFYHPGLKRGVWEENGVVHWYLRPGETFIPGQGMVGKPGDTVAIGGNGHEPADRPIRFDLGTPGKKDGYITIDLYESSADEQWDIHDLKPAVRKYGLADEIRASHILEHFNFRETVPLLDEWIRALKPGGTLFIEVPDLEWCCQNLLDRKDQSPETFCDDVYRIYGFQANPGDLHKAGFTLSYLRGLLQDAHFGLEEVTVDFFSYPDPRVQRAIRATARKRKVEAPTGPAEEILLGEDAVHVGRAGGLDGDGAAGRDQGLGFCGRTGDAIARTPEPVAEPVVAAIAPGSPGA